MAAPIPASLKQFTSILRRAEELERDAENKESQVCWVKLFCTIQPTVLFFQVLAYFCRLYIVTKGSKTAGGDNEAGLMHGMIILRNFLCAVNL